MNNLIKIEVVAWNESQLRLSKTHRIPITFFKLDIGFYNDQRFHRNGPLRLTYLYLFYLVASTGDDTIFVDVALASDCAGVTRKEFTLCLDVLEEQGRIRVDKMYLDPDKRDISVRLKSNDSQVESEKKRKFNETVSKFLDSVYEAYPKGRRSNPTANKKKLAKEMKTEKDMVNLSDALNNYLRHLDINKVQGQFVKEFKTFCNQWKDWISEDSVQDLSKPVFGRDDSFFRVNGKL